MMILTEMNDICVRAGQFVERIDAVMSTVALKPQYSDVFELLLYFDNILAWELIYQTSSKYWEAG